MVPKTGEKNGRGSAADVARFFQEVETVASVYAEIEQADIMRAEPDCFNTGLPGTGPPKIKRLVLASRKHPSCQKVVRLLIFNQKNADRTWHHTDSRARA